MLKMDFFTADNMNIFWGYVKSLLQAVSPGVMLWTALSAVGLLIPIIIKTFKKTDEDEDKDKDFDYKEY